MALLLLTSTACSTRSLAGVPLPVYVRSPSKVALAVPTPEVSVRSPVSLPSAVVIFSLSPVWNSYCFELFSVARVEVPSLTVAL